MTEFIIKTAVRVLVWLSTRNRQIGLRDWLMGVMAIVAMTAYASYPSAKAVAYAVLRYGFLDGSAAEAVELSKLVAVFLLAMFPIMYIYKLRRLGITDADYSVSTGIDYTACLADVSNGFQFAGVSASKLIADDREFREAVKRSSQYGGQIRMLLVDPEAKVAIGALETKDGTTAYKERIKGSLDILDRLSEQNENFEIRLYSPENLDEMRPFRLFFSGSDCLLSPFVFGTGEGDQGRSLPQLRITSTGILRKQVPTLCSALKRYFDQEWKHSERKKGGAVS